MNAPISSFPPGALADTTAARVAIAPACGRLSLRARGDLAPLEAALGLALPGRIGQRAQGGTVQGGAIQAMRLGPDEWILQAPEAEVAGILAACAALHASHPHSLVDISGREVTLLVSGPRAAELLSIGCPRDIDTIAVGEGRRTLFDDATVVLWRDAPDAFRMDVWNSFVPHLADLLVTGCRELAAETV